MNLYETDKLLAEYLLFHYGAPEEILRWQFGPHPALDFPRRCVSECVDLSKLSRRARALDLGCAVGRASFELAQYCGEVIAIDSSRRFIEAAQALQENGELRFERLDEGELTTPLVARVPAGIDRERVRFEVGDAHDPRDHLGAFDVLLMANLIDRLHEPRRCLERLSGLVNPGGQLVITSPSTWLEEFTPRANWLGGFLKGGDVLTTLDGLQAALAKDFQLIATHDLPFLIREHARKFQWSVAQATTWIRR